MWTTINFFVSDDHLSSLNMLDDLTLIFFTALLQTWISGLCIEDLSQMTDSTCLWIPYHKITLLTCCVIRNGGVKFWTHPPPSKHGNLSNSRALYHSQQAVIFSNREIIALQAAKGTQVYQAWTGWACPALWYSICSLSFSHGLCVFLLWPSPVPRSESLQGEEGHKAAELEQDVSLWHSGKDANVLCLLPLS